MKALSALVVLLAITLAPIAEVRPRIRELGVSPAPAARTRTVEEVQNDFVSPLFLAAVEAVEEAVYNSLTRATTVTGNGKTVEAIPIDRLRSLFAERKK